MITHISAYARIVENLAKEAGLTPAEALRMMQTEWKSDLASFFRDECLSAQIPVPTEDEMPEVLKRLWDFLKWEFDHL